jgi:8-oxo-dGTP pyrophosphatase MutT (NUDIX family)
MSNNYNFTSIGLIDDRENISQALQREVLEETGILLLSII